MSNILQKNYKGYIVYSNGNVWSNKTNKFLKPNINYKGYFSIRFSNNGVVETIGVHRLVALLFIPNPNKKREVNHINGIKSDNRVENLEWVSAKENMWHSYNVLNNKQWNCQRCLFKGQKYESINKVFKSLNRNYSQHSIDYWLKTQKLILLPKEDIDLTPYIEIQKQLNYDEKPRNSPKSLIYKGNQYFESEKALFKFLGKNYVSAKTLSLMIKNGLIAYL